MSNRRHLNPEPKPSHHQLVECQDCASTVRIVHDSGVMTVLVDHDDTCPWWRANGEPDQAEVAIVVLPPERSETP